MQGHRDKPTREELEEDQFLAWVLDAVEYVKERSQLFIGGVAAIVVAIMAITYVQASREEAKIEGSALLGRAAIADASGQFDEATRLHEQLAEEFGGTPAGAQGMVLLGNRYFAQARYADAQRLLNSISGSMAMSMSSSSPPGRDWLPALSRRARPSGPQKSIGGMPMSTAVIWTRQFPLPTPLDAMVSSALPETSGPPWSASSTTTRRRQARRGHVKN